MSILHRMAVHRKYCQFAFCPSSFETCRPPACCPAAAYACETGYVAPHGSVQEELPVGLLALVLSVLDHVDHQRAAQLQHTPCEIEYIALDSSSASTQHHNAATCIWAHVHAEIWCQAAWLYSGTLMGAWHEHDSASAQHQSLGLCVALFKAIWTCAHVP